MRYLFQFLLMVGTVLMVLGAVNWLFVGVPRVTPFMTSAGAVVLIASVVWIIVARRRARRME